MTTANQIKSKAISKYQKYLSSIVNEESLFPLDIPSDKKPGKDLEIYRRSLEDLINNSSTSKKYSYTLEFQKTRTKYLGNQNLPTRIYFNDEKDFVGFLNKQKEVTGFKNVLNQSIEEFPQLKEWFLKFPKKVLPYIAVWPDVLKVCRYFVKNPKPNLYRRELPIKVHTKFIENHQTILKELLNNLISDSIEYSSTTFDKRFNLKFIEPQIRFKVLDPDISSKYFSGVDDLSVPLSLFKNLNLDVTRIIIAENKISLYHTLTLPNTKGTIAVFGKGYSASNLKDIDWFRSKQILYWGDIDAHGFEILSQVRGYYPQTESILMDKKTFQEYFEDVEGSDSNVVKLKHLTHQEDKLHQYLLKNKFRLEQEKIPNDYVLAYFASLSK